MDNPIALCDATKLGQAVRSTSAGSIYICCVLHKEFNVAIRDKGEQISLRVEHTAAAGPLPPALVSTLTELGFAGEPSSHLSQHFTISGGSLLEKCGAYGAIIMQLKHIFGPALMAVDWGAVANAGS